MHFDRQQYKVLIAHRNRFLSGVLGILRASIITCKLNLTTITRPGRKRKNSHDSERVKEYALDLIRPHKCLLLPHLEHNSVIKQRPDLPRNVVIPADRAI